MHLQDPSLAAGGAARGLAALLGGGCGGFGGPGPSQSVLYRFPGCIDDLLWPQPQALGVLLKLLALGGADAPVPGWRRICQVLDRDWWAQHSPLCHVPVLAVPFPTSGCDLSPHNEHT